LASEFRTSFQNPDFGTPTLWFCLGTGVKLQTANIMELGSEPFLTKAEHAVLHIVHGHPLKAGLVAMKLMQRRLGPVQLVQIVDQPLDACMMRVVEKVSIQAHLAIPLAPLRELIPLSTQPAP